MWACLPACLPAWAAHTCRAASMLQPLPMPHGCTISQLLAGAALTQVAELDLPSCLPACRPLPRQSPQRRAVPPAASGHRHEHRGAGEQHGADHGHDHGGGPSRRASGSHDGGGGDGGSSAAHSEWDPVGLQDGEEDEAMASWEAERARVREELRQGSHSQYSGGAAAAAVVEPTGRSRRQSIEREEGGSRRMSRGEVTVDEGGVRWAAAAVAGADAPSGSVHADADDVVGDLYGDGPVAVQGHGGGGGTDGECQEEEWQQVEIVEKEAAADA